MGLEITISVIIFSGVTVWKALSFSSGFCCLCEHHELLQGGWGGLPGAAQPNVPLGAGGKEAAQTDESGERNSPQIAEGDLGTALLFVPCSPTQA